jgi:hypothetical protein
MLDGELPRHKSGVRDRTARVVVALEIGVVGATTPR